MTTGDLALLLYSVACVRALWLALKVWASWVNQSEEGTVTYK